MLTSLVRPLAALACLACLLGLTLMHVQFANDVRKLHRPPCYPDNVAFPEVFMKTLKQFKGQGAGIPIQCVLFALCALIFSVF